MDLFIAPRAGFWCRSVSGWDQFRAARTAGREPANLLAEPVPDLLPPREGRRAPLHVRLAIEAATQACRSNGVALADVMTVFASSMGDLQITDYMCRTLANPSPMLSPTKFHNSVHNAASGYWSIGAGNRLTSVAVAARACTFTAGLLEAASLAVAEARTALLIAYDIAVAPPLDAVSGNRQPFATALLLSPERVSPVWRPLGLEFRDKACLWPESGCDWLRVLASENDCARVIPLLEALADPCAVSIAAPLSDSGHVLLQLGS